MARTIRNGFVVGRLFLQYVGFLLRLTECPRLAKDYAAGAWFFEQTLRWPTRLRIVNAQYCPQRSPTIFVSNHIKLDDPFTTAAAAYYGSGKRITMRYVMRDDFISSLPKLLQWTRVEDLILHGRTFQISRNKARLSQIKPLIALLTTDESFCMFNGRSRTRSGLFFEYRDGIAEPGSIAFFLAHAQRRRPQTPVPAVPVARTFNPATKRSTVVLGEPLFLPEGAGRAAQRAFDFDLAARMGDLVEINVPHVLSGLLYLHCLHARPAALDVTGLQARTQTVFDGLRHRHVDPAAKTGLEGEMRQTLRYFAKHHMLRRRGLRVELNKAAILSAPPLDNAYKKANPVKYLTNQILHLTDVTALLERATFTDPGG